MSIARSLRLASLLPLVLLVTPLPAAAQFSSALQGTITDTQQAFVPNATVRVINTTTGVTREAETSADGVYRVPSLGAGVYTRRGRKVRVSSRHSVRASGSGISETLRLDFTLEVSGVAETVTVESRAPLVETEQGRVSGRVDRTLLQEMPLSGRNLYNLLALQPGVTGRGFSASISGGGGADDSFAGESAPRINASGQRDEANNFTVDDTSTNGVARGGITNLTPNTESVEEVRVVSNNFSAVDGRNPGAQIQVITKGGTNEFRGSGSYYFTGNQLSAKNVFETSVPEFSKNQFGYSLGGPIARNRLFFFTFVRGPAADRRARLDVHRRNPGFPQLHPADAAEQHCGAAAERLRTGRQSNVQLPGSGQSRAGCERRSVRLTGSSMSAAHSSFRKDGGTAINSARGSTTS